MNIDEELTVEEIKLENDIDHLLHTIRAISDKQIRLIHIKVIRHLFTFLPMAQFHTKS